MQGWLSLAAVVLFGAGIYHTGGAWPLALFAAFILYGMAVRVFGSEGEQ